METPKCCDTQWELIYKILLSLPDIVPIPPTPSTLQTGVQSIGSGVSTISVVFPTAYASAPTVLGSISRPVAEDLIMMNIDQASITTTGFTATLSGTTTSANYKLNWMAN